MQEEEFLTPEEWRKLDRMSHIYLLLGLVAFGAGVAMIGAGIFLATSGVALLATQLPNIATYGGSAAVAIVKIGTALTTVAVGAGLTTAAVTSISIV